MQTATHKIQDISLSSRVYQALKEMIVNDELKPGSRLVINQLCEKFGVSSTPVRDALHFLQRDGLINIIPNNGNYIIDLSKKDIKEIFEMREVLEGLSIRLVQPIIENDILNRFYERFTDTDKNFNNNREIPKFELDVEFHDFIIDLCPNARLKAQLKILSNQSYRIRNKLHKNTEGIHEEVHEHIEILEAMLKADVDRAETLMRNHIKKTKERILAFCFNH